MSTNELERLHVIRQVLERRLTQRQASEILRLSERQVRRLCQAYRADVAGGLISKHHGRPSNRRLSDELKQQALAIVRKRYSDFGPTLAHEN